MRKILSLSCIFLFVAFGTGCKDNPVTPPDTTSTMSILDASCTEAVISISIKGSSLPLQVTLKRNDSTIALITLSHADTVYTDTLLEPGHTYTYTMLWANNTRSTQAHTMDTTAHDWTWQSWTFGGAASSSFEDVAIINDTLAFAVGEVYLYDSTGQIDRKPYNLAVWNGKEWTLKRLLYDGISPVMLRSIFAINEHDVWLTPVFHWDGKEFKQLPTDPILFGTGVCRMWGDSTDLYAVGSSGFIGHRDKAGKWIKLESGTTLDFNDIWGAYNAATHETEILCIAWGPSSAQQRRLFTLSPTHATPLDDAGLMANSYSVWMIPNKQYYVTGSKIVSKYSIAPGVDTWKRVGDASLTSSAMTSVRGNARNDVLMAGTSGEILHFNGATWRSYRSELGLTNGGFGHLAVKNNLAIAIGQFDGYKALIAAGKK